MAEAQPQINFKKIVIGFAAYFTLCMLMVSRGEYKEFAEFVGWSFAGIVLSSFFLVPTFRILVTGKFEIQEKVSYALGFTALIVYSVFTSPYETVKLLLQWVTVYAFISTIVVATERVIEELLP